MSKLDPNSFLYLNRDNRWPDFVLNGLELGNDGAMRLATLPRLQGPMPQIAAPDTAETRANAIAIGDDGTIWFTASDRRQVIRIDPCDWRSAPVQCLRIDISNPALAGRIGGLAFSSVRNALLISDLANDSVRMFDAVSFQLLNVWDGDGAQQFNGPGSIAVDVEGSAYVVDSGNKRVVKFDAEGNPLPEFWETAQSEFQAQNKSLKRPSEVATNRHQSGSAIYVLDQESKSIVAFDQTGHYLLDFELNLGAPIGLAVSDEGIFVGDAVKNRIFKFGHDWVFQGGARGFQGSVTALALDWTGGLLVHTGGDPAIIRLEVDGSYVKRGWMSGGPFRNPSPRLEQWNRLKAFFEELPEGAHFEVFIYASDTADPPGGINSDGPPWEGNALELSDAIKQQLVKRKPLKKWIHIPLDVPDALFLGSRSENIWIGIEFSSEGLATASLSQMRLDFDHETYIQHLPSIYREDQESAVFLTRFLSLFESVFIEVEAKIGSLPELFDPFAVPPEFLQWLAGWLALTELDGEWSDDRKREVLAKAFDLYSKRGTVEGLRESLRFFAGIEAHIEEPLLQAGWWALPEDEGSSLEARQTSLLGFTTGLVAAEPQGAVVGTTATLDRSHLISQEEYGAPLFDDLAHRFSLHLYRGGSFSEGTLEMVRALVDREKPAHVDYHLCIVEPNLRVGFQSRIGIDTIVAGPVQPTRLSESTSAGGLVLGGEPAGRMGQRSSVGKNTLLGLGSHASSVQG